MFKSVLVANRGEIACRVFRTARRMGLRTIAVYSEADADALHVREADEAVLIGPAPARESYLDAAKVLAAAKATGSEAIHPGYGFLSENADFAEAVAAAGLVWIGPKPASIRAMGLKDAAKKLMIEAGVPVTPGYQGEDQSVETLTAEAARIGYPVLIKAVAGGGDRLGEVGVLGQEAVAGMDGLGVRGFRGRQHLGRVEVGFAGGSGADQHGLVGLAHVQGVGVGLGMDGDGAQAHAAGGAEHAAGDLATIGDQDGFEHARCIAGLAVAEKGPRDVQSGLKNESGESGLRGAAPSLV